MGSMEFQHQRRLLFLRGNDQKGVVLNKRCYIDEKTVTSSQIEYVIRGTFMDEINVSFFILNACTQNICLIMKKWIYLYHLSLPRMQRGLSVHALD